MVICFTMVLQWFYNGFTMVFQWYFNGFFNGYILIVDGVLLHQDSVSQVRQPHPPRSQTEFDQIIMG